MSYEWVVITDSERDKSMKDIKDIVIDCLTEIIQSKDGTYAFDDDDAKHVIWHLFTHGSDMSHIALLLKTDAATIENSIRDAMNELD